MGKISVNVRLRPVRFGFMVRPNDSEKIQKIFRINTCLWGGLYNPFIPYLKRVPKWWEREGFNFENAKQIVDGYLDFFEPDFIVEAERGLADGFGIEPSRILQLSEILPNSDKGYREGHGQTVFDLYSDLYKREFQFVRRHKHNIVSVESDNRISSNLAACLFGAFPKDKNLKFFGKAFKDAFDPQEINISGKELVKLYKTNYFPPLRMGKNGLEVHHHNYEEPTLFILDARESKDLIDFWNYRAIHKSLIAIPIQWLEDLSGFCKAFFEKHHKPLPGNPNGVMIHPTAMFSRSISKSDSDRIYEKHFKIDDKKGFLIQTWYPPIWRPAPEFVSRTTRPTITHKENRQEVTIDNDKLDLRFEGLAPDFAARFGEENRWANVVRLSDWSGNDRIATIFPSDFRKNATPSLVHGEILISTNEGLVAFPHFKDFQYFWHVFEGAKAIELWFKEKKIICKLSESGRATQQIIQTLDGFRNVRCVAHKGVIKLLDEMSRKTITRSMQEQAFRNKVNMAVKGNAWAEKTFESLVQRKAVELGHELKCSKCGSWSWYPLNQLDQTIQCELCLQTFDFPITNPSRSAVAKWAYRAIGPFALPDYAKGGYAAALAIRFFANVVGGMDSGVTWSAGQELTLSNTKKIEADFIVWYKRKQILTTDHPTDVLFGEAKSFGKDAFQDEDIERMKILAEIHPGSFLVFATLKEASELSKKELVRLKKLAEWGREYDKEKRRQRAPVIILTGTELFTPYRLEEQWRSKGGRHQRLVEPAFVKLQKLEMLADITQRLYLNLPSHDQWAQNKWHKRRLRNRSKDTRAAS